MRHRSSSNRFSSSVIGASFKSAATAAQISSTSWSFSAVDKAWTFGKSGQFHCSIVSLNLIAIKPGSATPN
jgi:hypothetical protein